MKFNRYTMTLMAAAALLSFSPALRAQTNTPPAARGPGGAAGRAGMRGSVDEQLTRLTEQLKLTDEEKPKVKAVLEEQNKQLAGLRDLSQEDRRAKMMSLREETNKKMKAVLTADQFKKYEEAQAARRRNGGPGGAPGPKPDGGNAGGTQ